MRHCTGFAALRNSTGYVLALQLLRKAARFFAGQSRAWLFIEALLMVLVVALVDYYTGYEVAVFPFYSVPILLVVWLCGERAGALICVYAALAWFCTDKASGHHYTWEWLRFWDAVIRMMFYLLVLFAGATLRGQRDAQRNRIELLERSQKLEREIINVSDREQARIGRDLHDGLCQFLAGISFAAGGLRTTLTRDSHPAAQTAGEISTLLRDSIVYARGLARGLSPVDRTDQGLESALTGLSTTTSRLFGIACTFTHTGSTSFLNDFQAIHLFRIAQEAVSNALRHGDAKEVDICLESAPSYISLQISDDGTGFNPDAPGSSGMGLQIMRYRAGTLGGTFDIRPNLPRGTIVACRFSTVNS
jgi:signal transduction histidine kinase